MKIPFHTPGRKWLVAALALALATAYLGLAASQFAASWLGSRVELKLGSRVELSRLEKAVWLDPGNAEYRNDVGHYYDLVAHDPAAAILWYRTAAALNPHSADYWFDLANTYYQRGDTANQTAALERAIRAEPTKPDVAWTAANFYLVQGENQKALREFRVVLANDPSLAAASIQFCWRIEPDVDLLLRDVVPPIGDAYIAFLVLLHNDTDRLRRELAASTGDTDPASLTQAQIKQAQIQTETAATFKVWNALMQSRQPFERQRAFDYVHYLVQQKEVDQAVLVWQQTVNRFGLSSSYLPSPGNLIVNGNFNLDVLDAGFDWQYQKQAGVQLTFDPGDFHAGRRSLMITFDGPGISDAGILQLVAVQPNTTYNFSAYYKSLEQQGAGGPHFTIQDIYTQAVYFESDELKDAGFWKSAEGQFTTGADCKLVVLHVRRLPAGSPIRGKLWIDDFRLSRKPS
jgi:tetratricopeptide (TPR) repeat protein